MKARFVHRRVENAEYRVRKMRNEDAWVVIEYYDGERNLLVDDYLTHEEAIKLASRLADRDEF